MKSHLLPFVLLFALALPASAATRAAPTADELARITAALPASAPATPAKPRRLLIFTLNVGYPGHASITHASAAFTLMGQKTGAYETVGSDDPAVFERESLRRFDAVFFNNTVGNPFTDPTLRRNLLEFVTGGGGLLGVHGTSAAFTRWPGAIEDWPEFASMLGARGVIHKAADEPITIKLDDADHPLNRAFGGSGFPYANEFFRFKAPYSRDRVRVLLSIDTAKTDVTTGSERPGLIRADGDYALAWVRHYGLGRVFYSTIGHSPSVFWDVKILQSYLAAVQFALGDLPAPTTPSAKLTPAIRAQEKLGWKLGIEAYTFHKFTFFETIEKTAHLGLPFIGGLNFQKVSKEIPKNFDPNLNDEELLAIRLKLDAHGLRLLTFFIPNIPNDEAGCRRIFEFGRKMGVETFLSEPKLEALPLIDRFCQEYGINVALHNHAQKASPHYWNPEGVLKACEGRSARIGACADVGYWLRSGIDPIAGARLLGARLLIVQMHDLNSVAADGHDVPWGTGVGKSAEFLRELHRLKIKPAMIGLEYSYDWFESLPKIAECIQFFNTTTLELAR